MNLGELTQEVVLNLGKREDLTDKIPAWINLGLERISEDIVFKEWEQAASATLLEGVRSIQLPPADSIHTVKLSNGSGSILEPVSPEEYDERYPEAHNEPKTGEPRVYMRWGNKLEFYPKSDKEYLLIIRFIRQPEKLENPEDKPKIPYDRLIIAAATVVGFTRLGADEEAAHHQRIYYSELESARRKNGRRNDHYTPRMKGFRSKRSGYSTERGRVFI